MNSDSAEFEAGRGSLDYSSASQMGGGSYGAPQSLQSLQVDDTYGVPQSSPVSDTYGAPGGSVAGYEPNSMDSYSYDPYQYSSFSNSASNSGYDSNSLPLQHNQV